MKRGSEERGSDLEDDSSVQRVHHVIVQNVALSETWKRIDQPSRVLKQERGVDGTRPAIAVDIAAGRPCVRL